MATRHPKSTLELAIEVLKVADLRMRIMPDLLHPKAQKKLLLSELVQARNMLDIVIDSLRQT